MAVKSSDVVQQFPLAVDGLLLAFAEFHGGKGSRVEVCRREAIQFRIDLFDLLFRMLLSSLEHRPVLPTPCFQLSNEPIRQVIGQRGKGQGSGDLGRHVLLPQVWLGAVLFHPLRASQVVMALLGFHGDEATAFGAAEKASIDVILEARRRRFAPPPHNLLDLVKEVFAHQRLVNALVHLALPDKHAVIEGIAEDVLESGDGHFRAIRSAKPLSRHGLAKPVKGVFSRGVEVKRRPDEVALLGIDDDGAELGFVEVSDRCFATPDAGSGFLPLAPSDIDRKIVGIIFALAEGEVEHQFALGSRFKPKAAKPEVGDFAFVDEVDDPPAVVCIAGEPVRVPGDDAVGLAPFNPLQHFAKQRPALGLGASALFKTPDDIEAVSLHKLSNLGQLVADRASLPLLAFGRFADVDEEFSIGVVHADTLARNSRGAKGTMFTPFARGRATRFCYGCGDI